MTFTGSGTETWRRWRRMHRRVHALAVVLWHLTDARRQKAVFKKNVADGVFCRLQQHVRQQRLVNHAALPD